MHDAPAREPAIPRAAATVLLVRAQGAGFAVLMTRRHDSMVFASALVFPGGTVDPDDGDEAWLPNLDGAAGLDPGERALRIAAFRETFEETGILLATPEAGQPPREGRFLDIVRGARARLDLAAMVPFAHWITPIGAPRRFDTHFYLCRAPDDARGVCDGGETVSIEWATPAALLARAAAGDRSILFPTRLNLSRLAASATIDAALAAARARPAFTVEPAIVRRGDAELTVIPAAAGYAETEDPAPRR